MDRVGTYMCAATIPMALLTTASALAGLILLALGDWQVIAIGVLAFLPCSLVAQMLEWVVVRLDDAAARALESTGSGVANRIAIISGGLPVLVILGWEIACLWQLDLVKTDTPTFLTWLWSYGIATGPWTAYAMRVSRFRRTLVGIRAYAGHLAYWLLSVLTLIFRLPLELAIPFMLLPAILPFTVGMLLAVADREALTNVRV